MVEPVAQRGRPDEAGERVLGVPATGNLLDPRGGEQIAHGSQRSNPIQRLPQPAQPQLDHPASLP